MSAAQHFPFPQFRVGKFVTQQVVLVAQRLLESDLRKPRDVGAARVAGESSPVHFGTAEVVVGRGVERTRPQCRPGTGVVLEAVRSPVECPELDMGTTSRGRDDGVARDALERARSLEDPGLGDEDPVGVGRTLRSVGRPPPQIRQPVARGGSRSRFRRQRRGYRHHGPEHLAGQWRRRGVRHFGASGRLRRGASGRLRRGASDRLRSDVSDRLCRHHRCREHTSHHRRSQCGAHPCAHPIPRSFVRIEHRCGSRVYGNGRRKDPSEFTDGPFIVHARGRRAQTDGLPFGGGDRDHHSKSRDLRPFRYG